MNYFSACVLMGFFWQYAEATGSYFFMIAFIVAFALDGFLKK